MKIYLGGVIQKLINEGYEVLRVDEIKKGMSDEEVIQLSNKEKVVLITFDKDFACSNKEKADIWNYFTQI